MNYMLWMNYDINIIAGKIKMKDGETIDDFVKVFIPHLEAVLVQSLISRQKSCVLSKKQQVQFF